MTDLPYNPPPRLTDQQIDRLDALLNRYAVPKDGMNLEMLDGFLSALVVGPELVMPSEYLPHVFNGNADWLDENDARDGMGLVTSLWNDVVSRLAIDLDSDSDAALESAMPLLAFPVVDEEAADPFAGVDDDYPLGAAWALGFLKGVGLRSEAWQSLQNEHEGIGEDLGMVMHLAVIDAEHARELEFDTDELLGFRDRLEIARDLPGMLQDLNALRLEALRPQPARRADEAGRNDPCPCGSGKKYKQCCGDPARLN